MKRFRFCVCLVLVVALVLPTVVCAQEAGTWASSYFSYIQAFLSKKTKYTFEIWFDVTATRGMDVVGVSEIKLQRSSNNSDWYTIKTYEPDRYTQMLEEDTAFCANCVSYTGMEGYYYRARVVFYAEKDGSSSELTHYTSSLYMPNV